MTSLRSMMGFVGVALLLVLLLGGGCGKPSLERIEIEPETASVTVGQTLPFQATGRDAKGNAMSEVAFSWSVDSEQGRIDAQGLFTALAPGPVTVTVTAEGKEATARVTVMREEAAVIIATVTDQEVTVGTPTPITVAVQNDADQGIPGVEVHSEVLSPGTTVDPLTAITDAQGHATFTVTAAPTVGANQIRFSADGKETSVAFNGVPGAPARLQVAADPSVVTAGEEGAVQVTVVDQAGNAVPDVPVLFETLTPQVTLSAEQVTTDAQGQARTVVQASPRLGSMGIRVSVAALPPQELNIASVAGAPAQLLLEADSPRTIAGGPITLTARVQDRHGNPVASVPIDMRASPQEARIEASTFTTDAQGAVYATLYAATAPGDNQVQAVVAEVAPVSLTVAGQAPERLHILPRTINVAMQGSYRLRALAADAEGHTIDVRPEWKVLGDRGRIDQDGVFTATALGSEVVLASYEALTAGAELTVVPGQAATLKVEPEQASLVSGTNQRFQVTILNAHGYALDVVPTWQVVGDVGSMDASGLFTATRAGRGAIEIRAEGLTTRVPVTVSPGALAAMVVNPAQATVQAGEEVQFTVTGQDAAGNEVAIEPTWRLAANIGELTTTGLLRAMHVGEGHIRVESGTPGVTVDIPVTVLPAALARIVIEPQAVTLSAGEEVQFVAAGLDAFDNPVEIAPQWQLTEEIGSLDANGKLLARKSGTARVQATADAVVGDASLVVKPGPLTTLSLEPSEPLTLTAGDTVTWRAVGEDAYGNVVTVVPSWRQSEPLGTLTSDGQFRAEKAGEADIIVESGDQTASVHVQVAPGKLAKIAVSPSETRVPAGEAVAFHAIGYDAYDNEVSIQAEWRVVNDLGSIDASGVLKAVRALTGEVVATAAGVSGRSQVTVVPGPVTHLEVTPRRLDLIAGEQAQITVLGYDSFGNPMPTQPVWQVTEGMGVITPDGLLTAQKAGSGQIVAAVKQLAIVVALNVMPGDLARLRIEPQPARVASGKRQQFTVQGTDRGGNVLAVEPTWEVRGDIGTMDETTGVFTGRQAGRGAVVATVGTVSAEVEVEVEPGDVATLQVTPETTRLVAGDKLLLNVEAFDAAGNRVSGTPQWSVEPAVGVMSEEGVFQAQRAGSGSIMATWDEAHATVTVEVNPGPLTQVQILPATLTISAGGKLPFTAAGYDAFDNAVPITARWSLQGGVGQIDPEQGVFHATTAGSGTVVAVVGNLAGLAPVTVEPAEVARVSIEPATIRVRAGDEVKVRLTAMDAYDNVLAVDGAWALTAPLGQLSDGVFTAERAGTAGIVGRVETFDARTTVEVRPGPLVRLQVTPRRLRIPAGQTHTFRAIGYDAYGNAQPVESTWQVPEGIGTMGADGIFTAGKQGRGQLTARFGSLSSQAEVVVVPGEVKHLVVTAERMAVAATHEQPFSAHGVDAAGNEVPVTVNWAITGGIGHIDADGRFKATQIGTGHVVAYNTSLMQAAAVEVTPGPVALLFVSPQRQYVPAGGTLQFEVQGFDAYRNPIQNLQPEWSVLGEVGTIEATSGLLRAQQQGWGKVHATVAGVQGSADVLVGHGEPDAGQSRMVTSRLQILADGKSAAEITVLVRDRYGNPVPEAHITLISSREDDIDQPARSNQQGIAVGRIRSVTPGQSEINAVVESNRLDNALQLTFYQSSASG